MFELGADIEMRIGCHSGPVIAGVVGLKMPRFYFFFKIQFHPLC